jgi:hypothetical protein
MAWKWALAKRRLDLNRMLREQRRNGKRRQLEIEAWKGLGGRTEVEAVEMFKALIHELTAASDELESLKRRLPEIKRFQREYALLLRGLEEKQAIEG